MNEHSGAGWAGQDSWRTNWITCRRHKFVNAAAGSAPGGACLGFSGKPSRLEARTGPEPVDIIRFPCKTQTVEWSVGYHFS